MGGRRAGFGEGWGGSQFIGEAQNSGCSKVKDQVLVLVSGSCGSKLAVSPRFISVHSKVECFPNQLVLFNMSIRSMKLADTTERSHTRLC